MKLPDPWIHGTNEAAWRARCVITLRYPAEQKARVWITEGLVGVYEELTATGGGNVALRFYEPPPRACDRRYLRYRRWV